MQLLRVADAGGAVSVGDIAVVVEPVSGVVRPCVFFWEPPAP